MSVKPLENRLELNTMCNLSEGIVDRVTERVTERVTAEVTESVTRQRLIEDVRNLMISTGWSSDKTMDALRIPKELRDEIRMAVNR